jgi:hypothetical protein
MNQYECSSLFGPDETRTAESPEGAAELYAEDHIDTDVDQLEVSYSFTATEN